MYTKEKLLKMLSSDKASVRYDACEWIRVSHESSPEIVTALEKATHDVDKEVAKRATLALRADMHHQMAIKMGMIEPEKTEEKEGKISQITTKPGSAPMNDKTTKKMQTMYKLGKIFLGIFISFGIFSSCINYFLISLLPTVTNTYETNEEFKEMMRNLGYYAFIRILIPLFAFLLVKKYKIIVGTVLLVNGIFGIFLIPYAPKELIALTALGYLSKLITYLGCYFIILIGLLFLISGLIERRIKVKQIKNQI